MSKQEDKVTVVSKNEKRNTAMVIIHPAGGGTQTRHIRLDPTRPCNPRPLRRSKRELAALPKNHPGR